MVTISSIEVFLLRSWFITKFSFFPFLKLPTITLTLVGKSDYVISDHICYLLAWYCKLEVSVTHISTSVGKFLLYGLVYTIN